MYFLFSKAGNFETSITRVPYNKLLTNLACSSRTGEYWPSVVFVRTSLRSVRTATTSGQYSPVRPSRSVSKRLILALFYFCVFLDRDGVEVYKHAKNELGQYPAILTSHLVNNPYLFSFQFHENTIPWFSYFVLYSLSFSSRNTN